MRTTAGVYLDPGLGPSHRIRALNCPNKTQTLFKLEQFCTAPAEAVAFLNLGGLGGRHS